MNGLDGIYADIAFWAQIQGDLKRTILCEPHHFDQIQAAINERGYTHLTLHASPLCPAGKLIVLDDSAMEAAWQQTVQAAGRSLYR